MALFDFIVVALVVGLVVWAINAYTPIPSAIKQLILVASLIVLVILLLQALGIISHGPMIPRLR